MDAEETLLTAENLAPNTKIVEDQASWQEIVEFLGGSKAKAQLLGAEIITNHDQYVRDVDQLRLRLRETYRGLLLPRGLFVQTWDMVTGICLLYTLFVTTYEVGLDLPTKLDALFVINQCVSLVFLTDIVVQFFLPVPDLSKGEGAYERRHYMLAKKYICSWFCLDLVTIVPFDVLVMSGALSGPVKMTKIMRVLRLFKLLKVLRGSAIIERWQSSIAISSSRQTLITYTFITVVLLHVSIRRMRGGHIARPPHPSSSSCTAAPAPPPAAPAPAPPPSPPPPPPPPPN